MLSQTFFVKVANGLQAKVPLHPGCIYTFEPVPEAGPYDERNKSYLQLVENTAGPPGGDGIFRVIASRGVVTIQRDEYTPVALNSFIDRCDPNADVSYGPSGRPFPFEKVTPEPTKNPRHPYALCLKKLETELDYFYPGARVELDHIVKQGAGGSATPVAAKKVAATPVASPSAVPSTRAAATAGGGAAPKTAAPLSLTAAQLKADKAKAQDTGLFSGAGVYADLEVELRPLSDEFLATATTDRTTLLVEAFRLIKELQEYDKDALLAPFVAEVASVFRSAREDPDTEFGRIDADIKDLLERIDAAKRFQLKKDLVDNLRSSVTDARNTVQDPEQSYGQTILAARNDAALDLTEVDEYIGTFKARIVTELRERAESVFESDDSASQLEGITKSIEAYERYKIFSKELNPDETGVDTEYATLKADIEAALDEIRTDVAAVWDATRGRCNNMITNFVSLAAASTIPVPNAKLDAAEAIMTGIEQYCNYTQIPKEKFEVFSGENSTAINAMELAKALNENPYAMFAMPDGFRTTIETATENRTAINGKGKMARAQTVAEYGGWDSNGTKSAKVKDGFVLNDLPAVRGVTA